VADEQCRRAVSSRPRAADVEEPGGGDRVAPVAGVEAGVAARVAGPGPAVWMRLATSVGSVDEADVGSQCGAGGRRSRRRPAVACRRVPDQAAAYERGGRHLARWVGAAHVQI
jgi:hypothetical protein